MTCIVALVDKGDIYMGGDSAGVAGLDLQSRADEKIFRNGPMVFGFTTSFRMGQLLRYSLKIPKNNHKNDYSYMCTDFIDAVRDTLKKGGWASKKNETENGGTFLVGYHSKIYCIQDDYQVAMGTCGYNSVGCGDDYAKGVLFFLQTIIMPAKEQVRHALTAAAAMSAGVRAPFKIIKLAKGTG